MKWDIIKINQENARVVGIASLDALREPRKTLPSRTTPSP